MDGITKAYPGVLANDHISVDLQFGEVHALLGENGAGKSTLMAVTTGNTAPDQGQIYLRDEPVQLTSPRQALLAGIGYVQQHVALIPTMSVAENMAVSLRATGDRVGVAEAARLIEALCAKYGMSLDVHRRIAQLGVADQQRAELLKALLRKPEVLVLDEPTTLLTPQEASELTRLMSALADEGIGVFFISHKLEEVLGVADRISVLRRGRIIETVAASTATREQLAGLMVGDLVVRNNHQFDSLLLSGGEQRAVVLEANCVSVQSSLGGVAVRDATMTVREGEVLGIAGLEGSGQVELTEALAGVRDVSSGEILLLGKRQDSRPIREWRSSGVAHIPADRLANGFIPDMSIIENLLLPRLGDSGVSRYGMLRRRQMRRDANSLMTRFDIRGANIDTRAGGLSGGNQQKMVLARELAETPRVIICCYATRGLDFRSSDALHAEITRRRDQGCAVVYASVDLEELLSFCDRIAVMHAGEIVGVLSAAEATAEGLGLMMGGVKQSDGQI